MKMGAPNTFPCPAIGRRTYQTILILPGEIRGALGGLRPKELRCLHLLSLETLRSRTERGATITRPALQLPYSVLKTLGHSFNDLIQTLLLRDVKDQ